MAPSHSEPRSSRIWSPGPNNVEFTGSSDPHAVLGLCPDSASFPAPQSTKKSPAWTIPSPKVWANNSVVAANKVRRRVTPSSLMPQIWVGAPPGARRGTSRRRHECPATRRQTRNERRQPGRRILLGAFAVQGLSFRTLRDLKVEKTGVDQRANSRLLPLDASAVLYGCLRCIASRHPIGSASRAGPLPPRPVCVVV